jgi:DNA-binding transcriptional LysR family regulator
MNNIEIFAIVVEQMSLNRASRILNLSQPALSRKIMALEEELGVNLFERKGKRLVLTQIGHTCYEHALQIRSISQDMQQKIMEYKLGDIPSSLTIGASLTTLQSTLPDLITLYTAEHPHTDIKALTGKTHEIVTLVREKKVDIGLIASSIDHTDLHCVPLFDDHLCLVFPNGHPYMDRPTIHLSDIHELPMILFSKGTWYRILMDELFHRYAVFPNVKMEIDSFEAILRLVSTCKAATLLPMSYLRHSMLDNNDLIMRNITELEQTKRTTSLIYVEEALRNVNIQAFIAKTQAYYPKSLLNLPAQLSLPSSPSRGKS